MQQIYMPRYSIDSALHKQTLTITLKDHEEQILYSNQYLHSGLYQGIHNKMDTRDIHASLSYIEGGRSEDVVRQQKSVAEQFSRKMLGAVQEPFYRIQSGGVVYVYSVLFDFCTKNVIRYESKLTLNLQQPPANLSNCNQTSQQQKQLINHVSISSLSDSIRQQEKNSFPGIQQLSQSSQQISSQYSLSIQSQDKNQPQIIQDSYNQDSICDKSIFDELKHKVEAHSMYNREKCSFQVSSSNEQSKILKNLGEDQKYQAGCQQNKSNNKFSLGLGPPNSDDYTQPTEKLDPDIESQIQKLVSQVGRILIPYNQNKQFGMKKNKYMNQDSKIKYHHEQGKTYQQFENKKQVCVFYDSEAKHQIQSLDIFDVDGLSSVHPKSFLKTREFAQLDNQQKINKVIDSFDEDGLNLLKKKINENLKNSRKEKLMKTLQQRGARGHRVEYMKNIEQQQQQQQQSYYGEQDDYGYGDEYQNEYDYDDDYGDPWNNDF